MKGTPPQSSDRAGNRYHLAAFGLNIKCDWPLPGSSAHPPATARSLPTTSVRVLLPEHWDAAWGEHAERIFEPEYPDHKTRFTVDRTARHYLLWFEGFGRYVVAIDGTEVGCQPGVASRDQQERFLFAQVLPLAAVLQGYEALHASAVCHEGGAAAFVGRSGAGKTSLASRLVARGAGFVTDDVLALESRQAVPIAHPGPAFMAVPNEDRSLIPSASGRLGTAVGGSDKIHASPRTVGRELPLRALYYIEPGPRFEIAPLDGVDARRVLATAFAPYLMTSARLRRHLELAHLVSIYVPQFGLQIPRTGHSVPILEALETHLYTRER